MSWQEAVDVSQEWVKTNDAGFTLGDLTEESRRIDFASPHGTFHVTLPETPGTDEWVNRPGAVLCMLAHPCSSHSFSDRGILVQMVWSEEESCVQRLSENLEYMAHPKRQLIEVEILPPHQRYKPFTVLKIHIHYVFPHNISSMECCAIFSQL